MHSNRIDISAGYNVRKSSGERRTTVEFEDKSDTREGHLMYSTLNLKIIRLSLLAGVT